MKAKTMIFSAAGLAAAAGCAHAQPAGASDLDIITSYAKDYEGDQFFKDAATFGVKVGEKFYTVEAAPASDNAAAKIMVRAGAPKQPTFYFVIENSAVLQKLDAGEINALTLSGKAEGTDYAPLDIDTMEGFTAPAWFGEKLIPFIFHFWTRGTPELVPFASQETRFVHGANLGVFYYQPGLRSAWFDIRPGQHVNEGEDDTSNPFPSMFIIIEGELTARIGDKEFTFTEGNMLFVPAGAPHEFINESDKNAVGFLFMFGEGA